MSTRDLCTHDLSEIAALLERREVSPVAITEATLERIARLDGQLNAFITVMADEALEAARAAEAEIAAGRYRGPLHGVPLSLKDLYDTRGVRTTAGARVFAARVPERDATATGRLREAGAVIIGKANMLEFAYGEVHPDFGPSHNPWNIAYGTSGSSSGSGAAVAAGLGYGSLGSDTGGSIRLPAAYCGIVGLKPTYGRVSRAGVVPLSWSLDHAGPMTRTVRDCALLLQAIAGHDPADPTSAPVAVPDYTAQLDALPRGLRVGVIEGADAGLTAEVRASVATAADIMRGLGCEVKVVVEPHPVQAARATLAILYPEASAFHLPWLRKQPEDYSVNTRERLELGALLPSHLYVNALRARQVIAADYRALLREVDVLLSPPAPFPSYRLDAPPADPVSDEGGERMGPLIRFTAPYDLTGLPALSVPCGRTAEGLPIGMQFAGRPFSEALLFQVAHAFEQATADWRPATAPNEFVV